MARNLGTQARDSGYLFGFVVNDCPYIVGGLQICAIIPWPLFKLRKFRSIFFWSAFVTLLRIARSFFSAFAISLVTLFSVKLILAMLFPLPGASKFSLLEGSGRFREVRARPA